MMGWLTVAGGLGGGGVGSRFVCGDHPGNMAELLRQRSVDFNLLPRSGAGRTSAADEDYGDWLGGTQAEDAEQTIRALDGEPLEWLIVDHYALDADWQSRLRAHTTN